MWWRDFEAYALKNKFYGVVRGQNSEKPLELGFQADATYPQCVMWLISLAVFFFLLFSAIILFALILTICMSPLLCFSPNTELEGKQTFVMNKPGK